jgi:hypothetical protein
MTYWTYLGGVLYPIKKGASIFYASLDPWAFKIGIKKLKDLVRLNLNQK